MQIEIGGETERRIREHLAGGRYDSAEQVVDDAVRQLSPAESENRDQNAPRTGGQWRGQVRIAEDFDELPADLRDAFGVNGQ